MFKKLFAAVAAIFMAGSVYAGKPLVAEAPISSVGTGGCVAVSNTAWTAVPALASVLTGRVGSYFTSWSTNTALMAGVFATATEITSISTKTQPIIFSPGVSQYHAPNDQRTLYAVSLGTPSSETMCYQSVAQ